MPKADATRSKVDVNAALSVRVGTLILLLTGRAGDFTEEALKTAYEGLFGRSLRPLKPRTTVAWERLFGFGEHGRRYVPRNNTTIPSRLIKESHLQNIRYLLTFLNILPGSQLSPQLLDNPVEFLDSAIEAVRRPRVPEVLLKLGEQLPAPVLVEERDGKVARLSDGDSPLNATERDFNAWREVIIDHVNELSSTDFRPGTNHSRARERLIAIDRFLSGSLAEVKERQFRIGYEIERLDGLISAYRSGGDDMPELNAAALEDLHRLRIALVMGIDKLERWAAFRRVAADDPMREGSASPVVISDALDTMASTMEQLPKYFEPEVPKTFRFMAEAARDPWGATKTVVYGGVRSAENVLSFLGQRTLGIGKSAASSVEQHISRAVAISLITALSGAALSISGALPSGWAWLKPLLDTLMKIGG